MHDDPQWPPPTGAGYQRLYDEVTAGCNPPFLYLVTKQKGNLMKELTLEELRALIRLIPAMRAMREELEKSLHLEFYKGMGDMALKSYRGMLVSVHQILADA